MNREQMIDEAVRRVTDELDRTFISMTADLQGITMAQRENVDDISAIRAEYRRIAGTKR